MRAARLALLLLLPLAACGGPAQNIPPAPTLPPGVFGVYEGNPVGALNYASWAWASSSRTHGNPVEAMRAVIALEYLPGEINNNPRWIGMDLTLPVRLNRARDKVQQILGIQPNVPPQIVVNVMIAASRALLAGNRAAALQALSTPGFSLPPEETLHRLENLPYVQSANLSTSLAKEESLRVGGY